MGCLDLALLSVRGACGVDKPLVLVWLFARPRRDAQRSIATRRAVLCFLAILAKKVVVSVTIAVWFCGDFCVRSFALAFANTDCLGCRYFDGSGQLDGHPRTRMEKQQCMDCWCYSADSICRRSICWRKFCLSTNRFSLRQRTLPISFHQLVLQPAITAFPNRLVSKRVFMVAPIRLAICRRHAAMVVTHLLSLPGCALRSECRAPCAEPRLAHANRNRSALAGDVWSARTNARALSNVGCSHQRRGVWCQREIEHTPFHHLDPQHGYDCRRDADRSETRRHHARNRHAAGHPALCFRTGIDLRGGLVLGGHFDPCCNIATAKAIKDSESYCSRELDCSGKMRLDAVR